MEGVKILSAGSYTEATARGPMRFAPPYFAETVMLPTHSTSPHYFRFVRVLSLLTQAGVTCRRTVVDRVPASQTCKKLPSITLLYTFCRSRATFVIPTPPATSLLQWFCQMTTTTRCPCQKSYQCWRLPVSTSLKTNGCHQKLISRSCLWMITAVMCTASSGPSTPTPPAHTCSSDLPANMLSVSTCISSRLFQFSSSLRCWHHCWAITGR